MDRDTNSIHKPVPVRGRTTGLFLVLSPPLLLFAIEGFSGVTLATTIPNWLYFIAIMSGAVYSYLLIDWLKKTSDGTRSLAWFQIVSVVGVYSLGVAPYLVRQLMLLIGFAFLNPSTTIENYVIDGSGGRKGPDKIYVEPVEFAGRRFSVFADHNLKSHYLHISTHSKDCVSLPTQRGRKGMKRVLTPSIFDYYFNNGFLRVRSVVRQCKSHVEPL